MATTQIADVIVPDVFNPYVVERTAQLSAIRRSGLAVRDPRFDALAQGGGKLINMPFWQDLSGADEVLSDSSALTPAKITSGQDVAALLMRGKAWSVNDLAHALAGDDPMRAVGDLVAEYWARREQDVLISILTGVFADNVANDSSDLVNDIASEDRDGTGGASNDISASAVIDTAQLLGDAKGMLTALVVHSAVHAKLQKDNLITFEPTNVQDIGWGTYLGKTLIVDDRCPTAAGSTSGTKYTSYLFGQGAIAVGEGSAPVPSETDRDSLAGDDILINRRHFIFHPRGIAFQNSSVSGASPTNAELENAANWDRVWTQKNIRIASLVSNAG
jgi:hypothetical protein